MNRTCFSYPDGQSADHKGNGRARGRVLITISETPAISREIEASPRLSHPFVTLGRAEPDQPPLPSEGAMRRVRPASTAASLRWVMETPRTFTPGGQNASADALTGARFRTASYVYDDARQFTSATIGADSWGDGKIGYGYLYDMNRSCLDVFGSNGGIARGSTCTTFGARPSGPQELSDGCGRAREQAAFNCAAQPLNSGSYDVPAVGVATDAAQWVKHNPGQFIFPAGNCAGSGLGLVVAAAPVLPTGPVGTGAIFATGCGAGLLGDPGSPTG